MAFTATQLAQMEEAAATGQLRVEVTGPAGTKILIYQHLADLLQAIKVARADVAAATTTNAHGEGGKFRSRTGYFPGG